MTRTCQLFHLQLFSFQSCTYTHTFHLVFFSFHAAHTPLLCPVLCSSHPYVILSLYRYKSKHTLYHLATYGCRNQVTISIEHLNLCELIQTFISVFNTTFQYFLTQCTCLNWDGITRYSSTLLSISQTQTCCLHKVFFLPPLTLSHWSMLDVNSRCVVIKFQLTCHILARNCCFTSPLPSLLPLPQSVTQC